MIVCHCMSISDTDIHAAIEWMRASDTDSIITPGRIYHALGKSADCGGGMPLFLSVLRSNANLEVPLGLRNEGLRNGKTETPKCKATRRSSNISTRR